MSRDHPFPLRLVTDAPRYAFAIRSKCHDDRMRTVFSWAVHICTEDQAIVHCNWDVAINDHFVDGSGGCHQGQTMACGLNVKVE